MYYTLTIVLFRYTVKTESHSRKIFSWILFLRSIHLFTPKREVEPHQGLQVIFPTVTKGDAFGGMFKNEEGNSRVTDRLCPLLLWMCEPYNESCMYSSSPHFTDYDAKDLVLMVPSLGPRR